MERPWPVLAPLLLACGVADEPLVGSWTSQGRVCIAHDALDGPEFDSPPEVGFTADTLLVVSVLISECVSCADNVASGCDVSRDGDILHVSSSGSFEVPPDDTQCATICQTLTATCDGPALPAGTYTLEHGGDLLSVEIPSTSTDTCIGEVQDPTLPVLQDP